MHKSYMVPRTDAQIINGTKNRCTNHKWYQEQMY